MYKVPSFSPEDPVNRFEFELPRRKWWHFRTKFSLPKLQYIPLEVMREAAKAPAVEQAQQIIRLLGDPATARAIGRLNQPEMGAFMNQWVQESAVGLGESTAS